MSDFSEPQNVRDLKDLPRGTEVFVDTNIFYCHLQGKSKKCTEFFTRVAQGEVTAYVNVLVLSDLLHQLMLTEAVSKGCIKDKYADNLKKYLNNCRAKAQNTRLEDYQRQFENILKIGLTVIPMNDKLLVDTARERRRQYLLVGDSLHLGTMNRRRVKNREMPLIHIVTHDKDFQFIPNLTIWRPDDVDGQPETILSSPSASVVASGNRKRNAHT